MIGLLPGKDVLMSLDTALFVGLGIFLGASVLQTLYIWYRIRKYRRKTGDASGGKMTPRESFRFGLFNTLFYAYMIISAAYLTVTGKFFWLLGVGLIVIGLFSIRKPVKLVRDFRPMHADRSINLMLAPLATNTVTPDLILKILSEESVKNAIKIDLQKVCQIGGKEQWRLGLIMPGTDTVDPFFRIPIKRAAILNPASHFNAQTKGIMIINGAEQLVIGPSGWTYDLRSPIPDHAVANIREIEIDTNRPSAGGRSASFPKFLQEDGFPLKASYPDGDPLTTERGGTLVIDKGNLNLIYSSYFIQSRLIDDEGNLIYMGLDENFRPSSTWSGTSVIPSVSRKLYKSVEYEGYTPVLRYRSFPYASDYMLPILDTPMSDSAWADLFIDPRGKAKLFIAKQKTLEEWYALMEQLRQLFFGELKRKGNHLLGLTKDPGHLNEYFSKKQNILEKYFTVLDWSLV